VARVQSLPASDPSPTIDVAFDGWIFPRARVAFIWLLAEELACARH
jgi:hypothetical protein